MRVNLEMEFAKDDYRHNCEEGSLINPAAKVPPEEEYDTMEHSNTSDYTAPKMKVVTLVAHWDSRLCRDKSSFSNLLAMPSLTSGCSSW